MSSTNTFRPSRRSLFGAVALGGAAVALAASAEAKPASSLRISIDRDDPGERLYAETIADGLKVRVFLDGREMKDVVMADPGLGEIKRAVKTAKGNFVLTADGQEVMYETLKGRVRWEAIPA